MLATHVRLRVVFWVHFCTPFMQMCWFIYPICEVFWLIQPCSLFWVSLPHTMSYLSSVVLFSSWCSNNLHLNVSKTKEMCIDFRRNRTVISPIVINGEPVEQVDSFKYLGVILDEKLSFTEHVTALKKRSISSDCHVLRKLRAFYVDPLLLLRLYRSIIEPLLAYCSICYYPALSVKNRNRLLKISRFCQDHCFTYTKSLRNNGRKIIIEESSCCRYWVWSLAFYVLPCTSVSKEIPLYKM